MKKNKYILIIYLAVFVFSFLLAYYLINLIYGFIFSLFSTFLATQITKLYKKDKVKYENINKAYNFVNLLNVEMITSNNIYQAYESINNYIPIEFSNISVESMHDQLTQIASDLNINAFKMYIETLIIYDKQGGDFIKSSEIPTSLCQKNKVYYSLLKKNKTSKLFDISSLYLLFALVVIFVKSSLLEYYSLMMDNMVFRLSIFILLLAFVSTYFLALKQYFTNDIKGL